MKRLIIISLVFLFAFSSVASAEIINNDGDIEYDVGGQKAKYDKRYVTTEVHIDMKIGGQSFTVTFPKDAVVIDDKKNPAAGTVQIKASVLKQKFAGTYTKLTQDQVGKLVQTLIKQGGTVQTRATIRIYWKSTNTTIVTFQNVDGINKIAKPQGFASVHLQNMRTWFRSIKIDIDIPIDEEIKASGQVDLIPDVQLDGLDSSNRIKAGYGFGLKLNGTKNLGEVNAKNFYYQPTSDGYIKVDYVQVYSVDDFGLSIKNNQGKTISYITGKDNSLPSLFSSMLLPNSRGILNWNFGNKSKPVKAYNGNQVFTFNLDNNSYGPANKPLIYLTADTLNGKYNVVVGGGSAEVKYRMKQKYLKWHHPEGQSGHWDTKYRYWWDGPEKITIKDQSIPITVNGSMFEDDGNSFGR